MASIPALEESRIGLWAARGTWSFYNFGKFEDVRLELAMNLDDFEPADLGRCGEPYTVEVGLQHHLRLLRARLLRRGTRWAGAGAVAVEGHFGHRGRRATRVALRKVLLPDLRLLRLRRLPPPEAHFDLRAQRRPQLGTPAARGRSHGLRDRLRAGLSRHSELDAARFERQSDPQRRHRRRRRARPARRARRSVLEDRRSGDRPGHKADVLANHPANQTAFALRNILCGAAGYNSDPRVCGFVSLNGKGGPAPAISTLAMGASALAAGSGNNAALSAYNNGFLCTLLVGSTQSKNPACLTALRAALRPLNVDPSDCGVQIVPPNTVHDLLRRRAGSRRVQRRRRLAVPHPECESGVLLGRARREPHARAGSVARLRSLLPDRTATSTAWTSSTPTPA